MFLVFYPKNLTPCWECIFAIHNVFFNKVIFQRTYYTLYRLDCDIKAGARKTESNESTVLATLTSKLLGNLGNIAFRIFPVRFMQISLNV